MWRKIKIWAWFAIAIANGLLLPLTDLTVCEMTLNIVATVVLDLVILSMGFLYARGECRFADLMAAPLIPKPFDMLPGIHFIMFLRSGAGAGLLVASVLQVRLSLLGVEMTVTSLVTLWLMFPFLIKWTSRRKRVRREPEQI
jgi:hypothetical protein